MREKKMVNKILQLEITQARKLTGTIICRFFLHKTFEQITLKIGVIQTTLYFFILSKDYISRGWYQNENAECPSIISKITFLQSEDCLAKTIFPTDRKPACSYPQQPTVSLSKPKRKKVQTCKRWGCWGWYWGTEEKTTSKVSTSSKVQLFSSICI